jgi:hypothetical protein
MNQSVGAERSLSIEDLSDLRQKTESVSQFLTQQLSTHLETIRLIVGPRRLLGRHVRGGGDLAGADRAFDEIKESYAKCCGRPFGLSREINEDPVSIEARLEIYPWEYSYALDDDGRSITMTSPVRWVVSYRSGYTLSQLRKAIAAKESLRSEDVRQFLINALTLQHLLAKYPEIEQLLTDLRYQVRVEPCDGLGQLPLVSVSSCLPSFRPTDELIKTATRFSGVPAFIELVDMAALDTLRDPLRERIEEILR